MRLGLQGAAASARPPPFPSPSEYSSLPPARPARRLPSSAAPRRPPATAPAPAPSPQAGRAGGEGAGARPARALAAPLGRAEEAPPPCPPAPPSPPTFLGLGTRTRHRLGGSSAGTLRSEHALCVVSSPPPSLRRNESRGRDRDPPLAYGKPGSAGHTRCVTSEGAFPLSGPPLLRSEDNTSTG
ncbi:unnamed protein product [Nyctereutes procyonoides]|uniref:(raccoon dog) hypothetical protein n=1 Tax=Nyctereutes procyonoides TaxID=34880 RepID=A0A811XWD5_NYCPR|nr:unnamed protein product [Nyctereutes procyonoides]